MKYFLLVLTFGVVFYASAQDLYLKRGKITDSIVVKDSLSESYALYVPTDFDTTKTWPIVVVFDLKGRAKRAVKVFREAAEKNGYLVAASNNISDTLSITQNILVTGRLLSSIAALLPVDKRRVYTAGFAGGGRFAGTVPTFVKEIRGVISCGAPVPNTALLNRRKPLHFIGIVGTSDFNYPEMLFVEKELNRKSFENQLLVFEGGEQWPPSELLVKALEIATLSSMAKKDVAENKVFVDDSYQQSLQMVNVAMGKQKQLLAYDWMQEMIEIYTPHRSIDSLLASAKTVRKGKGYRLQNRSKSNALFKESFLKDDFDYYLEEDIRTYNYNNLGWWTYQMEELEKYEKSTNVFTMQMGQRLKGYVNALVADNIDLIYAQSPVDLEALNFLWMLKTITAPKEYENYLKVISNSALIDDDGTALFYLEELLKAGYTDVDALYSLEHTAILRISPEYNALIEKYLKASRYEPIEE